MFAAANFSRDRTRVEINLFLVFPAPDIIGPSTRD